VVIAIQKAANLPRRRPPPCSELLATQPGDSETDGLLQPPAAPEGRVLPTAEPPAAAGRRDAQRDVGGVDAWRSGGRCVRAAFSPFTPRKGQHVPCSHLTGRRPTPSKKVLQEAEISLPALFYWLMQPPGLLVLCQAVGWVPAGAICGGGVSRQRVAQPHGGGLLPQLERARVPAVHTQARRPVAIVTGRGTCN
jgi:hypothetical protein